MFLALWELISRESTMTEAEMEKEVALFSDELGRGVFKIDRSTNTADNYEEAKEKLDSDAFAEFLKTDLFKEICLLGKE
jgi:hypothetical protein